jgi:rhodanese-related sulfurtransferase
MKAKHWLAALIPGLMAQSAPNGPERAEASPSGPKGPIVLIDVRTPHEFQSGHLKDALNIDIYSEEFQSQIANLDRSKRYGLYCRSGNRSGQAARLMKSLGFTQVENLGGVAQASRVTGVQSTGASPQTRVPQTD